ncbi:hypothetical protein BRD02_02695 [Halobacteriales archaeon QS_8_69_73]|nr:MAG: hypothetical protein BRD02_02695 [Halobacteriales archaeon QS_8_69_73]
MPEDIRDVHKVRAAGGVFTAVLVHAFMLADFFVLGLAIIAAPFSVLDGLTIESTPDPILALALALVPSATGLAWLYFAYLKYPTRNFIKAPTHASCREFVYNTVDDPEAAQQWADTPLPNRTRRWLAVIALAAPVTVFAVTELDTTFITASLGLLLAVGFVQSVRTVTDTTSLRPLSQHMRYIFAGPFILSLVGIPVIILIVVLIRRPILLVGNLFSWNGPVIFTALYVAACVSGHCATLLYDSRKIETEQQSGTSTIDGTEPSEGPSTVTGERSSNAATDSGETVPTQVFVTLAGVLVVQAVGALIFLPFSSVIVAAAAIVQSIAIFGAVRYIAPGAVRPRATLVGGGAVGGLGFLLGAEVVDRSTSLELLSNLSGGVAVVTIGFIATYVTVAGVSGVVSE